MEASALIGGSGKDAKDSDVIVKDSDDIVKDSDVIVISMLRVGV